MVATKVAKSKKAPGALSGRRIVVTGAGSGMGRAIAERFAAEGAQLALTDINDKALKSVARRCGAFAVAAEVSSEQEIAAFITQSARELGGIDGIINAAGIYENLPFGKITPAKWQRVLAVNLTGPYLVCYHALPHLRRANLRGKHLREGQATIVNISSTSFHNPFPGMTHYASSKAGLIGLTRSLAIELAPAVRVNAICPGTIRTALTRALYPNEKALEKAAAARTPAGRIGEPEDLAEAALFLTSAASSFISGTIVTVAGGSVFY